MSLDDLPKKVQYMVIDSKYINGTNNTFSLNLSLESNAHVENMSRVIGVKVVDFYITDVGESNPSVTNAQSSIAEYIDIVCPDIPSSAQLLDERHGQILERIPLERQYTYDSTAIQTDKQWKSYPRETNYFNPITIKQLHFRMYESRDNNTYTLIKPSCTWYMIVELTTVDPKEKPRDKNVQILQALEKLTNKIEVLNMNVKRLPDKPVEENKKYPFGYLIMAILTIMGGFIYMVNKSGPAPMV
tara:strand:+ start:2352 stop:3083 length:732 start_codon:yes stop_codon:yes gene_type:complete